MTPSPETARIIEMGTLAPSGDNSQPWSFRAQGPDDILVVMHPERDHSILNTQNGGTLIAIGALIENISLAAPAEGRRAKVDTLPDPTNSSIAARIRFSPDTRTDGMLSAIHTRHTNRGAYRTDPLPSDFVENIEKLAERYAPNRVLHVSGGAIQRVTSAACTMEEIALTSKDLHGLFFSSITWSKDKHERGEPGLHIDTLELPPPVRALFRILPSWRLTSALNSIGFARLAARGNAKTFAQCGAIFAVTSPTRDPSHMLNAGRLMERLWVEASGAGLAAHPLAGLLYLAEYVRSNPQHGFASTAADRILLAEASIRRVFDVPPDEHIAMLLRVGTPRSEATARSQRLPPVIF